MSLIDGIHSHLGRVPCVRDTIRNEFHMAQQVFTHQGTVFAACNAGCAEAFKADRDVGLNYGLHKKPGGGFYLHREAWSIDNEMCAYCGTDLNSEEPPETPDGTEHPFKADTTHPLYCEECGCSETDHRL